MTWLRTVTPDALSTLRTSALDEETLAQARDIVDRVKDSGDEALREYAERFGEIGPGDPLVLGPEHMQAALGEIDAPTRGVLERAASRIGSFAHAQRASIRDVDVEILGGRAGHTVVPVESAACYAPAGRYPLPSSVLMTAMTARAAGCARVVVVSPSTDPVMLAAAAIAGADAYIPIGGAHAIAALAYGTESIDPCDVIVGPGNAWVTAAKHIVSRDVGIDMLAGPSELLIIADETSDPDLIAADLLAQAEHDPLAIVCLVTTCEAQIRSVNNRINARLERLETRETAIAALGNSAACVAGSIEEAIRISDAFAPEHLEIITTDSDSVAREIRNAGALFIGAQSAEVFGDYGTGPNHTLPTGGTARHKAGLSVMDFLRVRSWISITDPMGARAIRDDAAVLASIEGLAAHRESALARDPSVLSEP